MGFKEDEMVNVLIFEDFFEFVEKKYKVVKIIGNGDCLYNVVLLILVGNELYIMLLWLFVVFEFVFNVDFYV